MRTFIIYVSLGFAFALPALAQQSFTEVLRKAPVGVSVSYNYLRANAGPGQCGCFSLNGGNAEAAFRLYKSFNVVAEIGGEHTGQVNLSANGLSLVSYTVGLRYTRPFGKRLTPFTQALIGGVHGSDSYFPQGSGSSSSANSFAYSLGGGLDVGVNQHIAVRVFQTDFMQTFLPNAAQSNRQNLLRISSGLTYRFGK